MIRKIVKINEDKCNGCGLCIQGCHEGALQLIDGKARLVTDSYCDGLGACLPACPVDAITIEEREADEFNEEAVVKHLESQGKTFLPQRSHEQSFKSTVETIKPASHGGCPGSRAMTLNRASESQTKVESITHYEKPTAQLNQWPCQIKLVPVNAPYFNNAHLLVAADCTAFAYANIHSDFMKNKITMIGCPKLDEGDYAEKLTAIIANNEIKSVTVLRMEVPCCGGIVNAVKKALQASGKMIPWNVTVISTDGRVIEE